jgi:hypothetical protein
MEKHIVKQLLLSIIVLAMGMPAFAYDKEVPGNTPLAGLPKGSRLVVIKSFEVERERATKQDKAPIYGWNSSTLSYIHCGDKVKFANGEIIPIKGFSVRDSYVSIDFTTEYSRGGGYPIKECSGGIRYDRRDGEVPVTVNDFNSIGLRFFRMVYDDPDPYPGMDKGVVVDIVMKKITAAIKAGEHAKALTEFSFLEKQGEKLPESFYYYYTETLEKTGKKAEAREHANDYLKRYGKGGKYYSQVIEIISRL